MYIQTPFNYTGSKFKLLEQIIPEMDYTKPGFVDLFCGGGSVYTNVLDKYSKVLANDIIYDLIGIHEEILNSDDIIERTKLICPGKDNKDGFLWLRKDYNDNKDSAKLWALMLSSTNNMMRFNRKFLYNQTYGNRGWNKNTDKKVDEFKEHIRKYKDRIKYTSSRFSDINIDSSKIMYYLDPPYSNTEAGYNAYWNKGDDTKLYEYIKNIDKCGSSFMLSGSLKHDGKDSPLLNDLINDKFKVKTLDYNYNKVSRKGNKETEEIIITNY
jgi:DNA adenine methylase Dam